MIDTPLHNPKLVCQICDFTSVSDAGVAVHVLKTHGIGANEYWETHFPRFCEECNGQIRRKTASLKQYWIQKYCSIACRGNGCRKRGMEHPFWKGGRYKDINTGYIGIRLENFTEQEQQILLPMSRAVNGQGNPARDVSEHRAVMALHLGRPLTDAETVHHKNGSRADNRLENLELWVGKHPAGMKAGDVECPCCGYVFNRFTENGKRNRSKAA